MKPLLYAFSTSILLLTYFSTQAAQELTPEKASQLKAFERISINGRFNSIGDAVRAISARADALGAEYFYIQDTYLTNNSGNVRIIADLYHKNAKSIQNKQGYERSFLGIKELSQQEAKTLQPLEKITIRGYFANSSMLYDEIAKQAKEKNAASFYIYQQKYLNGGNQLISVFLYKMDAPLIKNKITSNLPKKGQTPLTTENVDKETSYQQRKGYVVTLRDGTKIEELNKTSASQMTPFDSIVFTDYFSNTTQLCDAVAKRAVAAGAKYYHITRQWQKKGGNITVSVDLFK